MVQTKVESITSQLRSIQINASSPHNDGWVASSSKKDLVMLRYAIDKLIKQCPDFGKLEDEWEQEILINILKEEQ
jgi:hypothetical protein